MGFSETRWSRILLASSQDEKRSRKALEELCAIYWHPIYSYVRRRGYSAHDAEDLTQQWFAQLLEKKSFENADQSKGRFRNFLLGALNHFLISETRKASAQKRGGGRVISSAEIQAAEERYLEQPDPGLTPEQVFDRQWTGTLLQRAFSNLRAEFEEADQLPKFHLLKRFLGSATEAGDYDKVASELGMTSRAVGMAVHRLRDRYRELVRAEVADTVAASGDVEEEFRELFG